MKSLKKISQKTKSLLLLFAICSLVFGLYVIQDYRLSLGQAYIRFDADSNMIKFGNSSGTPPMIAREFNSQLFKFNSAQFSWSSSTGLNLYNAGFGDSIITGAVIIKRDTTFGENTLTKMWRLKRTYYHENDSTVLMWHFSNTDYEGTSADWYAINTYQEDYNSTDRNGLTTGWATYCTYTPPHDGLWRVEAVFEYEFPADSIIVWGTSDSISVRMVEFPMTTKAYWNKKIYNPYNTRWGESGTGYIFTETRGILLLQAVATTNGGSHRYLSRIKIKSMLIQ